MICIALHCIALFGNREDEEKEKEEKGILYG
jgi:hypothetical protein